MKRLERVFCIDDGFDLRGSQSIACIKPMTRTDDLDVPLGNSILVIGPHRRHRDSKVQSQDAADIVADLELV